MGEKKFKTTKADERAALELIRNILAELDPAGYVNTAFEGCCDIAESNIDNDFACSWKRSYLAADKELGRLINKNKNLCIDNESLQAHLNTANKIIDTYKAASVIADEVIDKLKKSNACLLGLLVDRLK